MNKTICVRYMYIVYIYVSMYYIIVLCMLQIAVDVYGYHELLRHLNSFTKTFTKNLYMLKFFDLNYKFKAKESKQLSQITRKKL